MSKAKRSPYSDHARLNRDLAARLPDSETKSHLFEMANLYERLAAEHETRDALSRTRELLVASP
jgi:hypothetical protein